ncbi:MAG: hypothetical protein AB1630_07435 [bacterium]
MDKGLLKDLYRILRWIANNLDPSGTLNRILNIFFEPDEESVIEIANSIPRYRVDKDGNSIPVGIADERGYVQWEQKELKTSINPLRDKSKVKLGDGTIVKLPVGVKDKDVDVVISVAPKVNVIKLKDDVVLKEKTKESVDYYLEKYKSKE